MSLRFQQVFTSVFRNRYSDLPVFPAMPLLPVADGDMAELDQLADQIIDDGLGDPYDDYMEWFRRYRLLQQATWIHSDFHVDPWLELPTFQQLWDAA